ncbi:Anaphase-promoting complex subunit 1 family protein [Candida parapsilosis]|uniref:Anaphase-promoting complex subunit 1 family protein n=1 Tax=Candida parapsilosis TaxID=5480 RepID=A0A8X7NM61_CANPA|nr:Anaphase-promoting complex subunit 1 family protein [Candida parapsilosis]KAF6049496.1 Anaphase-promoting complex subunit 1 family protein [Candida parapsilosis]KAF6057347.1 Anaphase-promoting complex subunit 1 family protein [Candida parapsilosis]KAF6065934.1 Anaphase-promoting complex subunit 1 family protein [Candida parapsilosis]
MSGIQQSLTTPVIDYQDELELPIDCENVVLCDDNVLLLIKDSTVTVYHGLLVSRVLKFDDDIIRACVTSFLIKDEPTQIMAICFKKYINFYYPNGKLYTLHLPFDVVLVKDYDRGLVLQTRTELYLINRDLGLKFVDTDTNSSFHNYEYVTTFDQRDTGISLCTTFVDGEINVYQVKNSSRNLKFNSKPSSKSQKKKHYSISTSSSKYTEPKLSQIFISENRTSTLLSDARISNPEQPPISSLRKDVILSKIETVENKLSRNHVKIFSIPFDNQEGVVVVNKLKQELHVYSYNSYSKSSSIYKCSCLDCIPFNSTFEGNLIVLTDDGLFIVNPFLELRTGCNTNLPVCMLISSNDGKVALRLKDDSIRLVKIILDPVSDLISACLRCFKYLSGSTVNQILWSLWRTAYNNCGSEWNALVVALLSLTFPFSDTLQFTPNEVTNLLPQAKILRENAHVNYNLQDLIPYIVVSLHLLREEYRLDVTKKHYLNMLGTLLCQLTIWMGWPDTWVNYYNVSCNLDKSVKFLSLQIVPFPPNLFESLASLFTDNIVQYLSFSQLVEESDSVDAIVTPVTNVVLKLFEVLVSLQYGPAHLVDMMSDLGVTSLETFPLGVSIPLKEALSVSQEQPNFEWTSDALLLTGREDLSKLLSNGLYSDTPIEKPISDNIASLTHDLASNEAVSSWDDQSEAKRLGITKLIFDHDRRYFEITTLLHQTKMQTAFLKTNDSISEYDLLLLQRKLASIVAVRTLTIPMGRAALNYGGRKPLLTEKYPIPKFNLNTLISPTMTTIIPSEDSISQNLLEWGHFHNGVSSGLSIAKDSKGISGSWIIFNKPPDLNSQHAGFLFGLGLNGHLKKLEEWHIYNYLGPKHPLTSVGLLIGMAASLRGTMDNKLTKVLSVHAVALLPQGANDLNVPITVQTAGLIGIGLLYLETQHRRMSEILLSQITGSVFQNDVEQVHEGYRLASGVALGFVNLGKGDDLKGLNDTHVVDRLKALATFMKNDQPGLELDKSCCGAIIALCLIYLKTENANVADKLSVPESEQVLDYIRPDLLFLRCMATNLITWSTIGSTREWIESQVPTTVLSEFNKSDGFNRLDSDELIFFNVLGGACLAMALKYASSSNIEARDSVLYYLDKLMLLTAKPATNYDEKLTYNTAINIQNILALCASLIMAAGGDLKVFQRLRVLHNDTSKSMGYGGFMAINTALGFLFLGGGQMAFDDSLFGIASLITSLYPIFPKENSEYEVHLQALRHFWALAIVPRCLVVKEVGTNEPYKIPITITMRDGTVIEKLSPCLLPKINDIQTISTNSIDYFEVVIDCQLKSEILENFEKSLTIYVYKKQNYQLLRPSVRSMLQNKPRNIEIDPDSILNCELFKQLDLNGKEIWINEFSSKKKVSYSGLTIFNIIDDKLRLIKSVESPDSIEDVWNLRLLFGYANMCIHNDDLHYIPLQFINQLKQKLWNKVA